MLLDSSAKMNYIDCDKYWPQDWAFEEHQTTDFAVERNKILFGTKKIIPLFHNIIMYCYKFYVINSVKYSIEFDGHRYCTTMAVDILKYIILHTTSCCFRTVQLSVHLLQYCV